MDLKVVYYDHFRKVYSIFDKPQLVSGECRPLDKAEERYLQRSEFKKVSNEEYKRK